MNKINDELHRSYLKKFKIFRFSPLSPQTSNANFDSQIHERIMNEGGGLYLPLPVSFTSGSCSVSSGSRLFHFSYLFFSAKYYSILQNFQFLSPWESCFSPSLLLPPPPPPTHLIVPRLLPHLPPQLIG